MEQIIKRFYYPTIDFEIKKFLEDGYHISNIASTGNDNYVWALLEKNKDINNTNSL